ncbi:MAG: hypothetical protein KatS3mg031_0363 [Chitinophagales bacterium]|nr:MAG: hypothetical protein KatS3mg031_0363 [Chitinophagales bacterium]
MIILFTTPLLSFAQPGKIFCGQGYSEGVYVYDAATLDSIAYIDGAGGYRMVLSPDGSKIYSTGGDENVFVIDPVNNALLRMFDPSVPMQFTYELEGITISPDGKYLYVFDEYDPALFVIITENDSTVAVFTDDIFYEPENCVITPDGNYLFMVDNNYVHKISTTPLALVASFPISGDAHGVAISKDGSKVYTEGSAGLYVFDASTLDTIKTVPGDGYFMEISANGTRLYAVDESKTLYVLDAAADTILAEITLSQGEARGVTTNANSDVIFIATSSGMIRMDAGTFTETATNTTRSVCGFL